MQVVRVTRRLDVAGGSVNTDGEVAESVNWVVVETIGAELLGRLSMFTLPVLRQELMLQLVLSLDKLSIVCIH